MGGRIGQSGFERLVVFVWAMPPLGSQAVRERETGHRTQPVPFQPGHMRPCIAHVVGYIFLQRSVPGWTPPQHTLGLDRDKGTSAFFFDRLLR